MHGVARTVSFLSKNPPILAAGQLLAAILNLICMCKCATKYCRNEARKGRFCYKCEHANRKEANPYKYWFGVLRRNARRRGKPFALTFDYWVQWCDFTGYLALKGRRRMDATIDCKINALGYADGNIQPLTNSDNSFKGTKSVQWNYITHQWEIIEQAPMMASADDLPF
jgi:hypothetical protein